MYKLYYYPLNASMAPRFILEKLNVAYELILVDRAASEQTSEEYLALNPFGRIPTLIDGDVVLFESPAICLYLAEKNAEVNLIPRLGSLHRPVFHQWLMYLTNTLQAELMTYSYPDRYFIDQSDRERLQSSSAQRITSMFEIIDSELAQSDYLVGDGVTVCDYFLFMLCIWADELGKPPLAFHNVSRYLRKMAALDEVSTVCLDENLSLHDYQ